MDGNNFLFRILKKKISRFPQKYYAAQLFPTVIMFLEQQIHILDHVTL